MLPEKHLDDTSSPAPATTLRFELVYGAGRSGAPRLIGPCRDQDEARLVGRAWQAEHHGDPGGDVVFIAADRLVPVESGKLYISSIQSVSDYLAGVTP
jgi:hypothetical protein